MGRKSPHSTPNWLQKVFNNNNIRLMKNDNLMLC